MSNPDGYPVNGFFLLLKVSRIQLALATLIVVLSLAAIWMNDAIETMLAVFVSLALLISGWHFLSLEILRISPEAMIAVTYGDGRWRLTQRSGEVLPAVFLGPSFIGRQFIALEFELPDGRKRLVSVLADATDHDMFRRLRVMLKLGQPPVN